MKKYNIIYKHSGNCLNLYKSFIKNVKNIEEAKNLWLSGMYGNGFKETIEIISITEEKN